MVNDKEVKKRILGKVGYEPEETFNEGEVNWLSDDDEYYQSWKRIKNKNYSLLKGSEGLFQLFGSNDTVTGKPQIRSELKKTNITLIVKCCKKDKDGLEQEKFKFVDDYYNKRDDGYEIDTLEKSYWIYDVIEDGESFLVFCDEKIDNQEIHTFYGMKVKVPHKKEFDKNLSCRGSANLFFCKKAESTIKVIPKEKIIDYVDSFIDENKINKSTYVNIMLDYIFTHDNGNVYRHPLDYMLLRHAHLLSSKVEGYPLQLCVWGSPGLGKTIEAECTDRIFQEGILEAGNSTPKALIQSFKEKPANPGFILSKNRIAIIDELMKMIDNQISKSYSSNDVRSQLGQLNMILEHKKRTVGSGNDNSLTSQATAKTFILTNPSNKSKYLDQELSVLDSSTLSRLLPYCRDENHERFIEGNKIIKKENTYSIPYIEEEEDVLYKVKVCYPRIRDFYVTIYDSCQQFLCKVDEKKVDKIFKTLIAISENPLKTLWKRRGLHHTLLILDGIIKYRCIFKDFDNSFEANEEDYINLERIMVMIVKSWKTNMGIKSGELLSQQYPSKSEQSKPNEADNEK